MNGRPHWSAADEAELNLLVFELVECASSHRAGCPYCRPCSAAAEYLEHKSTCWSCDNGIRVATATWGPPCSRYLERDAHIEACASCAATPCPKLTEAIEAVVTWQRRRELWSRAIYMRAGQDLVESEAAA